jgi:hypothetical protein
VPVLAKTAQFDISAIRQKGRKKKKLALSKPKFPKNFPNFALTPFAVDPPGPKG